MSQALHQSCLPICRALKRTALLAVLTVALLNPLACLLHCELLRVATHGSSPYSFVFLCHSVTLPALETTLGPAAPMAQPPRAIYAATLLFCLLLPILAPGGYYLTNPTASLPRRSPDAPPVPPPRLLCLPPS